MAHQRNFQTKLKRENPEKYKYCVNCGSDIDIKMHHIVPLAYYGNDIESNIVPLCAMCHSFAHLRKISDISRATGRIKNGGRKEITRDGYLSPRQASEISGLSIRSIQEMIHLGEFSSIRSTDNPRSQFLIPEKEFVEYIERKNNGEVRAMGSPKVHVEGYLSIPEFAKIENCSCSKVGSLVKRGVIRVSKLQGNRVAYLISEEEFNTYIKAKEFAESVGMKLATKKIMDSFRECQ